MKIVLIMMLGLVINTAGCTPRSQNNPPSSQNTTTPVSVTQNATPSQSLVEAIKIFKAKPLASTQNPAVPQVPAPGGGIPPSPDWALGLPVDPHPANVQGVFSMVDKVFLGIRFAPGKEVTFSKYTLLTKGIGEEVKIDWHQTGLGVGVPSSDLGPFEGQAFPFFNNPMSVPREPGIYEIRVYLDDAVAASAVFEVKMEAVLVITIFPASGEYGMPPPGGWEREPGSYPRSGAVLRTFHPGDKFFLGMRINPNYATSVTISKYTLFSKNGGQEKELAVSSRDVGPQSPGGILFPAMGNLWIAPNEPGIYEIRVYSNNEVIASAVFEVVPAR